MDKLGEMKQRNALTGGAGEREREEHTARGRSTPPWSNLALWIRQLLSYPVIYLFFALSVQSQKLTTVNSCSLTVIMIVFPSSFAHHQLFHSFHSIPTLFQLLIGF